jgi:magnesium-transporting ATPase (P-type)
MWKHISLQALVQLIILLLLYFFAPHFIRESHPVRLAENRIIESCYGRLPGFEPIEADDTARRKKLIGQIIYGTSIYWSSDVMLVPGKTVVECGKYAARPDLSMAFKEYINANSSTSHMSLIFNIFVIYTLFNQINARIIDDSFNILIRIEKNILFPIITLVELVLQILILQYGNAAFKVIENGLTWDQWLITIGFSAVTFVLSAVIKVIPLDKFIDSKLNKEEDKPLLEDFKIMQGTKQETLLANV